MKADEFFEQHSTPLQQRLTTGLYKLASAIRHNERSEALAVSLSATQAQILAAMSTHEAGTPRELSKLLGVSLPTVSDSIAALVAKKLVLKHRVPGRGRSLRLSLTSEGRVAAQQAASWPEFLAPAIGTLPDSQQATLLTSVILLIRALQESGHVPVQRMCVTCAFFRPNVHEGTRPHHCALVDAPMAATQLRLVCDDHEVASDEVQVNHWEQFRKQAI